MFKKVSIRSLFVSASLIIILLIFGVVWSIQLKLHQIMMANENSDQATQVVERSLDSRFHIVQIQQFLTDTSLTGDLEGINVAKEHLAELKKSIEEIEKLQPSLKTLGDEVYSGAENLLTTGLEMVKSYIEENKGAGNAIMKRANTGFDAISSSLEKKTSDLVIQIKKGRRSRFKKF